MATPEPETERLTCANGGRWTATGCGPCVTCQAEVDRACAAFDRGVFFGDYLPSGHTPKEWAAREGSKS